jgi:predicted TIM-barrel fold metal-dependent hydrolase
MANSQHIRAHFLLIALVLLLGIMGLPHIGYSQSNSQTRFDRQDRNHDGRLSRREFKGPAHLFNSIDVNGDSSISNAEFRQFMRDKDNRQANKAKPKTLPNKSLVYVDTHNHLAGWVGARGQSQDNYKRAAQIAIQVMDREGIEMMLLMPTPQTVDQDNSHDIEDYLSVVKKYPDRFALLAGGGTLNVMIQQAIKAGGVSPKLRRDFEKKAEEILKKGALGFGEMTAEHVSMNETHPYITAPPDHPLFLLLADIAARYDVPIDIHMEAVPHDMPVPDRLRRMPNNPATLTANLVAFERLLAHNPNAKIIWAHAGWDNTEKRTTELSDRLLNKHPNLYMSIRVVSKNIPSRPTDNSGQIKPDWLELISKYQDRFVLGSDEFFMPRTGGKEHPSAGSTKTTVGFLSQLPKDIAQKIGRDNAMKLFKLKK